MCYVIWFFDTGGRLENLHRGEEMSDPSGLQPVSTVLLFIYWFLLWPLTLQLQGGNHQDVAFPPSILKGAEQISKHQM